MINAVIFDMDGVIADTEPIYEPVDRMILNHYGVEMNEVTSQAIIGLSPPMIAHKLCEWTGKDITEEEVSEMYGTKLLEALKSAPSLKLEEGLEEWLFRLKSDGMKLAVGSSSPRTQVEYIITRFGIDKYFDAVATTTEAGRSKPYPDIFLLAAKRLDVEPDECFVIEDSTNGVKAAAAAGMSAVGYTRCTGGVYDLTGTEIIVDKFTKENYMKVAETFGIL